MASLKKKVQMLMYVVAVLAIVIVIMGIYIAYPYAQTAVNGQPVGQRLSGIDSPLSSTALSSINNASNNYFEIAGEKLLNLSLQNETSSNGTYVASLFQASITKNPQSSKPFIVNGKPSVIYVGAISCIYCGENRWAMALALSRFGSFNKLYTGFSSLGDGDVPTLYWNVDNYTSNGSVSYGNGYQGNYINFISAEYDSPIKKGFELPQIQNPIQFFVANAPNSTYASAMELMNNSQLFQGTPFTLWGTSYNRGADAVVLRNVTTATSGTSNYLPFSYMTHQQIYQQLSQFNSTFAYEEYAAADIYVAQVCPSINNSASVCSLPAIKKIESQMGLS
jgi:hypothetical protein